MVFCQCPLAQIPNCFRYGEQSLGLYAPGFLAEFGHVAQCQTALGGCTAGLCGRIGLVFPDGVFTKLFTPAGALSSRLDAQQCGWLDGGGVVGLAGATRLALPLGSISQAMAAAPCQRQLGLDGFMAACAVVSNARVFRLRQCGRKNAGLARRGLAQ